MPPLSLASVGAEGCCITPGSGFFKLNENLFFLLFLPKLYYTAKIPLGMQTESLEITNIAHSSYGSLTRSWEGLCSRDDIYVYSNQSESIEGWQDIGHRAGTSDIHQWVFAQKLRFRRKHISLPAACFQVQLPTSPWTLSATGPSRKGPLNRSLPAGWLIAEDYVFLFYKYQAPSRAHGYLRHTGTWNSWKQGKVYAL